MDSYQTGKSCSICFAKSPDRLFQNWIMNKFYTLLYHFYLAFTAFSSATIKADRSPEVLCKKAALGQNLKNCKKKKKKNDGVLFK